VLRFIFSHCGVPVCTSHSKRFARLASGAFYCAVSLRGFYETIIVKLWWNQGSPSACQYRYNQHTIGNHSHWQYLLDRKSSFRLVFLFAQRFQKVPGEV
jgi:hypothetical protein